MKNDIIGHIRHQTQVWFDALYKSHNAASHRKTMNLWNTVQINFNTEFFSPSFMLLIKLLIDAPAAYAYSMEKCWKYWVDNVVTALPISSLADC